MFLSFIVSTSKFNWRLYLYFECKDRWLTVLQQYIIYIYVLNKAFNCVSACYIRFKKNYGNSYGLISDKKRHS